MAHFQHGALLIAFDEPYLTNMIPPFDFSCWTIALRLPYGMSTIAFFPSGRAGGLDLVKTWERLPFSRLLHPQKLNCVV
jgi:hypothetical protein